jgi:hypothetical protein
LRHICMSNSANIFYVLLCPPYTCLILCVKFSFYLAHEKITNGNTWENFYSFEFYQISSDLCWGLSTFTYFFTVASNRFFWALRPRRPQMDMNLSLRAKHVIVMHFIKYRIKAVNYIDENSMENFTYTKFFWLLIF